MGVKIKIIVTQIQAFITKTTKTYCSKTYKDDDILDLLETTRYSCTRRNICHSSRS
jgi:DNA-directed RNA polymerase subunit N (RpoN/RPB10)